MKTFFRWLLIGLAGLGMLVGLFYAEEDWRGWHAWNQFKHKWEAKGETFDLAGVVPPPVPDDRNFAMSPVWIAEIKYLWQSNPQRAKAWYGDRVDQEEVSRIFPLLPVGVSGLAGTNWWSQQLPASPDVSGHWATAHATDLQIWQSYYRDLEQRTPAAEIPVSPQPQSPAADVLLALGKYDPVIERLRQDSALPDSRFPVLYTTDDAADILLPHLAVMKRYAQVLQLRASAELQLGENEKALNDVKLMLRLTESVRTEPFIISHLVRIAILNLALQPVWEGLASHQWSDPQLAELDAELAKLDFLADYRFTLRGEAASQGGIIDFLRRHPEQLPNLSGNGSPVRPSLLTRIGWHLMPRGWFYQSRLRCARPLVELYIPLADTHRGMISPKAAQQADAAVQAEVKHRNRYSEVEKLFLSGLGATARKFAYGQESADLARVAIALERFRLVNGNYPETLDALEPRFIEPLPHDVINGQPLHYRLADEARFVLYSVGWNETDDGGRAASTGNGTVDILKGDWVWKN